MADDERSFLAEILRDEELARKTAGADTRTGVGLLLETGNRLLVIMLWRNRTGDDLRAAVDAVGIIKSAGNVTNQ